MKRLAAPLAIAALAGLTWWTWRDPPIDVSGCDTYVPSEVPLIAHAGGGLPEASYTNSLAALDRSHDHGFDLVELDFLVRDDRLLLGHDESHMSTLTYEGLLAWMDTHPGTRVVADLKEDQLEGLARLAKSRHASRFVAQIYEPEEYRAVRALGFDDIIFTAYLMPHERWQDEVNALPLLAVAVPHDRRHLAQGVDHPVYLHGADEPIEGFGLFTHCLVPAAGAPGAGPLGQTG